MNTILITGATGNVGRPLIEHLLTAGAHVRALTRYPEQAALPAAVEVVVTSEVATVLGRPATTFAQRVAEHRSAFMKAA